MTENSQQVNLSLAITAEIRRSVQSIISAYVQALPEQALDEEIFWLFLQLSEEPITRQQLVEQLGTNVVDAEEVVDRALKQGWIRFSETAEGSMVEMTETAGRFFQKLAPVAQDVNAAWLQQLDGKTSPELPMASFLSALQGRKASS